MNTSLQLLEITGHRGDISEHSIPKGDKVVLIDNETVFYMGAVYGTLEQFNRRYKTKKVSK